MAVTSVKESWTGDTGGWNSDSKGAGAAQVTRKFTVVVNNTPTIDTSGDVLVNPSIPQKGDPHPYANWFICRNATCKRISPIYFEVDCTYISDTYAFDVPPINEPAVITWDTITSEGPADECLNFYPSSEPTDGNYPIANALGEPMEGITKPVSDMSCNITKNIAVFDPTAIEIYTNTVNNAPYLGFAVGRVRCRRISAQSAQEDDQGGAVYSYWKATYQFEIRRAVYTDDARAWWTRVLHTGFEYFTDGTLSEKDHFEVEGTGKPVTKPQRLKDDGQRETDKKLAHFREFKVMEEQDFNALGIL